MDYMVVNRAFLAAGPTKQKSVYNAALEKAGLSPVGLATLSTAMAVLSVARYAVFVGERERVSRRRAITMATVDAVVEMLVPKVHQALAKETVIRRVHA